jgi:hypothetical protein
LAATAIEGANIWALHKIATDPAAAAKVAYAVKNHLSSRIIAPIIATGMLRHRQNAEQNAAAAQQYIRDHPELLTGGLP